MTIKLINFDPKGKQYQVKNPMHLLNSSHILIMIIYFLMKCDIHSFHSNCLR